MNVFNPEARGRLMIGIFPPEALHAGLGAGWVPRRAAAQRRPVVGGGGVRQPVIKVGAAPEHEGGDVATDADAGGAAAGHLALPPHHPREVVLNPRGPALHMLDGLAAVLVREGDAEDGGDVLVLEAHPGRALAAVGRVREWSRGVHPPRRPEDDGQALLHRGPLWGRRAALCRPARPPPPRRGGSASSALGASTLMGADGTHPWDSFPRSGAHGGAGWRQGGSLLEPRAWTVLTRGTPFPAAGRMGADGTHPWDSFPHSGAHGGAGWRQGGSLLEPRAWTVLTRGTAFPAAGRMVAQGRAKGDPSWNLGRGRYSPVGLLFPQRGA
eukprot:gene9377-biopygen12759